jgi:hypothetical protein
MFADNAGRVGETPMSAYAATLTRRVKVSALRINGKNGQRRLLITFAMTGA